MKTEDARTLINELDNISSTECTNNVLNNIVMASESLKILLVFYDYWRELYGQGLEVLNWHQNGSAEPFDTFFEDATQYII